MYTPRNHKRTFTGRLRLPRDYTKEITFIGVIATFLGIFMLSFLISLLRTSNLIEEIPTKKENSTGIDIKRNFTILNNSTINKTEEENNSSMKQFYLSNRVTKFQVLSEFDKSKSTESICLTEKERMINIPTKDDIKCIEFDGMSSISTTIHIRMSAVKVKSDDVHLYTFLDLVLNKMHIENNHSLYINEGKIRYCDFSFPYSIIHERNLNIMLTFEWNFNEMESLCFKGINLINSN